MVAVKVLKKIGDFLYSTFVPFPLVQICGESMLPTYKDGECLFATRLFKKSELKEGDVIVYKAPTEEGELVVKRVRLVKKNLAGELFFYCLGDNAEVSYDSRYYGFVSSDRVICKLLDQRQRRCK